MAPEQPTVSVSNPYIILGETEIIKALANEENMKRIWSLQNSVTAYQGWYVNLWR